MPAMRVVTVPEKALSRQNKGGLPVDAEMPARRLRIHGRPGPDQEGRGGLK